MKKICLINPLNYHYINSKFRGYRAFFYEKSPPLGIGYIASFLRRKGFWVKIIDRGALLFTNGCNLKRVDFATERILREFNPDVVGISVMTSRFQDASYTARLIRKVIPECLIIFGGFHPTAEPELTLKECPEVDLVVRGEGELTLLEILNGRSIEEVNGVTYRKNGNFYSTPKRMGFCNLDDLPFPARDLLDMRFYTMPSSAVVPGIHGMATNILSSRGCPGRCNFCASNLIHRPVRFHSPEYVVEEIESLLAEYTLDMIRFVDTMFLGKRERAEDLCRLIIKKRLNKRIRWAADVRADFVDRDILRLMKEAGCFYITYGFESGSQRMLDILGKGTTVEQNFKAAYLTKELGILINASMIVGIPGETEEDFWQTIDFLRKIRPHVSGLNILAPLPGSRFYIRFKEYLSSLSWELISQPDEPIVPGGIPNDIFRRIYLEAKRKISLMNEWSYFRENLLNYPILAYKVLSSRILG